MAVIPNFRLIRSRTLRLLNQIATERAGSVPLDEQVKIYQALAESLPTATERRAARELAKALSLAAAKQLEFSQTFERDGE